jgi:hypothetical protein
VIVREKQAESDLILILALCKFVEGVKVKKICQANELRLTRRSNYHAGPILLFISRVGPKR